MMLFRLVTYGFMGSLILSKKSSILLVCALMESRAPVSELASKPGDPPKGP